MYYSFDRYCDNDRQELERLHPVNIVNTVGQEVLEARMNKTSDYWF